ncbi:hypothetical protein [Amycolatopsis thailandensis]|uniref:hypothetical protein n=1 Tax=Amycolatopsis thailandensis TaxID=589330 RepID=UPI003628AB63
MLRRDHLNRLVVEIGQQGLLGGLGTGRLESATGDGIEEVIPAVLRFVDDPELPEGVENPGLTPKLTALALLAGARRAAADAAAIERAAAQLARKAGATVRELALMAGISERAANDRYRRLQVFYPDTVSELLARSPRQPGAPDELAGEIGDELVFAMPFEDPQTATFTNFYRDAERGDVYVVRCADGREGEIGIADIIRGTPRGQARQARMLRDSETRRDQHRE